MTIKKKKNIEKRFPEIKCFDSRSVDLKGGDFMTSKLN